MTPPVAALGDAGALVPGAAIRHVAGPPALHGPAYTVALPPGDNLGLHLAVARAARGDVIVASAGEEEYGPWGEILSAAALSAGIAGLVLDGYVRDASAITGLGFTVFARGTALRKTAKADPGRHGGAVTVAGAQVRPGDLVVGDGDGLVFVPAADREAILARAGEIDRHERALLREIAAGRTTVELLGLPEEGEA